MAFIGNREKNFKRYLEKNFEMTIPSEIHIFYAKGVRIGNRRLMKSDIHGELGYAACDFGFNPTNAIIQNFGHLAKKNVIDFNESNSKRFAEGRDIPIRLEGKTRHVIIKYDGHIVGLGQYDSKKQQIINRIPEKRRRRIINTI